VREVEAPAATEKLPKKIIIPSNSISARLLERLDTSHNVSCDCGIAILVAVREIFNPDLF
jgi:hypothetical protein